MKKHLVELLTEDRFTTVSVFFESKRDHMRSPAPAPTKDAPYRRFPSNPGSPIGNRSPGMNEMDSEEIENEMFSTFPFIAAALPERTYTYKVNRGQAAELVQGDRVVVPTGPNAFAVATVWRVDETPQIDYNAHYDYRWIVQKVDAQEYNNNLMHEQNFRKVLEESEKRRQREDVRRSMLANMVPQDKKGLEDFNAALKLLGLPPMEAPEVEA